MASRFQVPLLVAGLAGIGLGLGVGAAQAQSPMGEAAEQTGGTIVDITGFYLMTGFGGNPAFGSISPIVGAGLDTESYSLIQNLPDMDGGGVRFSVRRLLADTWFAGAQFTSFSTDDRAAIGDISVDTNSVNANLLDSSLADNASLNGQFDDFRVDYAMETIDLEQRFGDLVLGRRIAPVGRLSGFWQVGVRVADSDLDRDVVYQNLEGVNNIDTATINLRSEMWGAGPTAGAGATLALTPGLALSASTSVSALFSRFDLSRRDSYFNLSDNDTEIRQLSVDTQGIVPVFDASVELKAQRGRYFAGIGYTVSAWLGGARALSPVGGDDVDEAATAFTIRRDDLITHGVFARAGMTFGDVSGWEDTPIFGEGPNGTIVDITGYYLMTGFGGDPAFGSISPIAGAGLDPESYSVIGNLPDMDGGGVRLTAQRLLGPTWFAGAQFTNFATDDRATIGDISTDTDAVLANLLDGSLADDALLNGDFEDLLVDYAMETIDLEQRFGDLVVGRRIAPGSRLNGFWQMGVRVADSDLDRDVVYQNLEGVNDIDTATINIRSEMWGVGPTLGAGAALAITPGLALSASTSVSALFSRFDLSRRDSYFNLSTPDTEIRQVSLETQAIVPVFDASVELKASRGRYFASIGYTASAWLGGARSIAVAGFDDSDDESSRTDIRSDDLITHGVFARAGMTFGDVAGGQDAPIFGEGPSGTIVDITGYYLMTGFGGDFAFGSISPVAGAGIDPASFSAIGNLPDMEGGGVRLSAQRLLGPTWFAGAQFTGFATDDRATIGDISTDSNAVLANLLDSSLADNAGLTTQFDDFRVDYAMETIDLEQRFGDLVVGRRIAPVGRLSGFWQVGVRVADTDLDRDVDYQNLEGVNDIDTATINFRSEMWGVGPTMGAGTTVAITPGLALSGTASVSALFSRFDLSRRDSYFNFLNNDTEIRQISLETQGIVPVIDASVELTASRGRYFASIGYTVSAWLDGGRTIGVNGLDDSNNDATPYTIRSDDLITHGIFARLGMTFGSVE